MNTGFVFEENNTDHIVISGIPVNVTERSFIGFRTIIKRFGTEFQSSFSQNDTIAKSMAKSLA
jgi:DNA mismatch repair protein MutL